MYVTPERIGHNLKTTIAPSLLTKQLTHSMQNHSALDTSLAMYDV